MDRGGKMGKIYGMSFDFENEKKIKIKDAHNKKNNSAVNLLCCQDFTKLIIA